MPYFSAAIPFIVFVWQCRPAFFCDEIFYPVLDLPKEKFPKARNKSGSTHRETTSSRPQPRPPPPGPVPPFSCRPYTDVAAPHGQREGLVRRRRPRRPRQGHFSRAAPGVHDGFRAPGRPGGRERAPAALPPVPCRPDPSAGGNAGSRTGVTDPVLCPDRGAAAAAAHPTARPPPALPAAYRSVPRTTRMPNYALESP
jgi:hypothetical protein